MKRYDAQRLRLVRTEAEKTRRRIFGDMGAKFCNKFLYPANDGISNCITTVVSKDDLITEYEYN